MQFECYKNWCQLPKSADLLFKQNSHKSMFLTREWFETLYTSAFKDDQSLQLMSVVDHNKMLALLPLVGTDKNLLSLCHRYTSFYSLLLTEENQSESLACLAAGLNKMSIHSFQLNPIDEDDENLLKLQQALKPYGYDSSTHFSFYNWIHNSQCQSFTDYMDGRPSQLRNTIIRKRRKLEREHESNIRLFKGNEVEQGLVDYHAAYSASWKAHEQSVILLDALASNFSVPDWTRLAVLYIDGKAAATQLWFVVEKKANIFRLAYDENWKHYSPGSILSAYLMQHVIDIDKVDEIDFLTGNEAYKQDWMSVRRKRCRLLFVKQQHSQNHSSFFMKTFYKLFKFFTK